MHFMIQIAAVLAGVLVGFMIENVSKAKKKRHAAVKPEHAERSVSISEDYIQTCILPNNRGKSINLIVENLKNQNIDPDFTVDFSSVDGGKSQ